MSSPYTYKGMVKFLPGSCMLGFVWHCTTSPGASQYVKSVLLINFISYQVVLTACIFISLGCSLSANTFNCAVPLEVSGYMSSKERPGICAELVACATWITPVCENQVKIHKKKAAHWWKWAKKKKKRENSNNTKSADKWWVDMRVWLLITMKPIHTWQRSCFCKETPCLCASSPSGPMQGSGEQPSAMTPTGSCTRT